MQHDMLGLALLRMAILVCSSSFRNAEIQMNNPINMQHDMLGFSLLHIALLNLDIEMNWQSPYLFVLFYIFFYILTLYIKFSMSHLTLKNN